MISFTELQAQLQNLQKHHYLLICMGDFDNCKYKQKGNVFLNTISKD